MRRDILLRSTSVSARWLFAVLMLLLVLPLGQLRDVWAAQQRAPAGLTAADWTAIQALLPTQQVYLKASNTETNDQFGYSVAVSGDTVVVGAYGEDSNATGANGNQADNSASLAGAAYLFAPSTATSTPSSTPTPTPTSTTTTPTRTATATPTATPAVLRPRVYLSIIRS